MLLSMEENILPKIVFSASIIIFVILCVNFMPFSVFANDLVSNGESAILIEQSTGQILFEKMGTYNGRYHVLDGLISP